jgi:transcriptional regulator with XRE-family HTH domain
MHMKECSMTIEALALASGVSKRTVVNFVGPRKTTPTTSGGSLPSGTLANLIKLAAALNVEPWQLLCDPELAYFHEGVERLYHERVRVATAFD